MSGIRISLHLSHFFNDYRQLAKIYIGENLKTIEQLKEYIQGLFNIEVPFYLTVQNHYIPQEQDIRLIKEEDTIHLIPYKNDYIKSIKKKKLKQKEQILKVDTIVKSSIYSESPESEPARKRKRTTNLDSLNENTVKSNVKKTSINVSNNMETENVKIHNENCSKINILENKSVDNIIIPDNLKKGQALHLTDIINFNETISNVNKLQKEISTKEADLIKFVKPESVKKRSLEKSKIIATSENLLDKIGKKDNFDNSAKDVETKDKCADKEESMNISQIIECFSDCDANSTKNLSETKFQSWSDVETNDSKLNGSKRPSKKSHSVTRELNIKQDKTVDNYLKVIESKEKADKSIIEDSFLNKTQNLDLSKTKMDSWSESDSCLSINAVDDSLNESSIIPGSERKSLRKRPRKFLIQNSVGALLANLSKNNFTDDNINEEKENTCNVNKETVDKADSLLPETPPIDEVDNVSRDDQKWVTKRRARVRTRHRKSKKENCEIAESDSDLSMFQPPKSIAAPKIHKRFSDGDDDTLECESPISEMDDSVCSHSTPFPVSNFPELSTISEEKGDITLIPESEEVLEEPPKINSWILFKKLKLSKDYTPEISGNIVGEMLKMSKDKRTVELKIIAGHKEFEEHTGKYALNKDPKENIPISTVTFEWSSLVQPKLYKSKIKS